MPERHAGVASSRGGATTVATTFNVVHEKRRAPISARRRDAEDIIVITGNSLVPKEEDHCITFLYVNREINRVSKEDTREKKQEKKKEEEEKKEERDQEENDDEVDCRERIADCERRTERPRGFSPYGRG